MRTHIPESMPEDLRHTKGSENTFGSGAALAGGHYALTGFAPNTIPYQVGLTILKIGKAAKLCVHAESQEVLEQSLTLLAKDAPDIDLNTQVETVVCDFTNLDGITDAGHDMIQKLNGRMDGFIHAAGITEYHAKRRFGDPRYLAIMNVKYGAYERLTMDVVVPYFRERDQHPEQYGKCLVFSSVQAGRIFRGQASDTDTDLPGDNLAYGLANEAVIHHAKRVAKLCSGKATSNAIRIGHVMNARHCRSSKERHAMRQSVENLTVRAILEPDDIAGPVLFLLSQASNGVTGHEMVVDGGFHLEHAVVAADVPDHLR